MTAQPLDDHDPDDPIEILRTLPTAYHASTFGHGNGFLSFRFDEVAGLIRIFHIVWAD